MTGYTNGILMSVLRPALDGLVLDSAPDAAPMVAETQVGTKFPANVLKLLPFVVCRATVGGTARGPKVDTRISVPVQIDAMHVDSRPAHDLADRALWVLQNAWATQQVTADGHIGRITNISGPFEFIDDQQPDGLSRWTVTAAVTVRPPV